MTGHPYILISNIFFYYFIIININYGQADVSNQPDTILEFKEIIISATRKETDRKNLPYSTGVLSREWLDLFMVRSTPESLTGSTGIFIQKTNHGGGSAFVRGLTGNQTLTLIDGIRLNNPTFRYGPNQYLNTIDPFSISKIEVLRGSGSVQYGSDALGGVIHVLTRSPDFSEHPALVVSITGKAMSHDMEYSVRPEIQFHTKRFGILLGYTERDFGNLVGGKATGIQNPSGYSERSLDSKLKWQIGNRLSLIAAHQLTHQRDVPLYHKIQLENFEYYFFDPQIRELSYIRLESVQENKWIQKISMTSSFQKSIESRNYHKYEDRFEFRERDKVNTWGNTVDIFSKVSSSWSFNSGIEHYYSRVKSKRAQIEIDNRETTELRGLYPNDATSQNLSFYSLHHYKVGQFILDGGVRYNYFDIKIPNTDRLIAEGKDIIVKPASLVSDLSALYHLGSGHHVSSSISSGYRAPNIDDLGTLGLVDFRYEIPAYDLNPEKSRNLEIGYRFIGKRMTIDWTSFSMNLTDLITRKKLENEFVDGYNVYIKENSQHSKIRGFEFAAAYKLNSHWQFSTTTTYTHGQNLSNNEPMRRIPPLFGHFLIAYKNTDWGFTLEHQFAGKQDRLSSGDKDDNRINPEGTPGWNIFNGYAYYQFKQLTFRIGLQNIFNADYRTHGSGINGVGRSGFLGVAWEI